MNGSSGNSRLRVILGGLAAALVFLAWWVPTHAPVPLLPTADLYTHLSVARHLAAGEGFKTDIAYPLSFAFPFARELPQPLIHRGPGFALLLMVPWKLAGGDPATAVQAARWLQVLVLALIVFTGAVGFLRRGLLFSLGPWLVLLAANPLLVFAVDWGFEELAAGWLILMLWLQVREGQNPGVMAGILAGLLTLLRLELFWVPVLWWLWFGRERLLLDRRKPPTAQGPLRYSWRGLLLALAMLVVIQAPWAARNLRLTGQPFFSLQGQAELIKDTTTWPQYSVYKQLTPQPASIVLTQDPLPILRKLARGLKFFTTNLPRLLPWPFLVLGALLVVVLLRGKIIHRPCPFRPGREHPMSILAEDTPLGPLAAAALTTALLAAQYSFFDHSLRHLLVMVPVLVWEFSPLTGDMAVQVVPKRIPSWPNRPHPLPVMAAAGFITLVVVWITWVPLDGWDFARSQAQAVAPRLAEKVEAFLADPDPVVFVEGADVTWYGNRAAVWDPGQESIRQAIRNILDHQAPANP